MKSDNIRGILIDPYNETVTEITLGRKSLLHDLYTAIGCSCIDRVGYPDNKHDIVVDDEGLLKEIPEQKFFSLESHPYHLLAGRGVIVGTEEGEEGSDWESASLLISDVKPVFYDRSKAAEHARVVDQRIADAQKSYRGHS